MRFLLIAINALVLAHAPSTRYYVDDPGMVTVTRTVGDTVEFMLILDEPGGQTYNKVEWFIRPTNGAVLKFSGLSRSETAVPGRVTHRLEDSGRVKINFFPEDFALPQGEVCKITLTCEAAGDSAMRVDRCLRYNRSDDPAVVIGDNLDATTPVPGILPDTVVVEPAPVAGMSFRVLVVEPEEVTP